jgi:hypothetical protein
MLGAGVSYLGGNDALSGAFAGIIGESSAEFIDKNTSLSDNTIKELSGLAGGYSAIFTGGLTGLSNHEIAENVYSGQRIGKNAAENNALNIQAQDVGVGKKHLTIVHTPESDEQALYADKEGYVQDKETGMWYKTWGAGPDSNVVGFLSGITDKANTNLVSDFNRKRDADLSIKIYQSPNLVSTEQEGIYAQLLDKLDNNYKDNLRYNLLPTQNTSIGYNSNSYISGILNAAGIIPPNITTYTKRYQYEGWEYQSIQPINIKYNLPMDIPGYNKPIPKEYFGDQ